MSRKISAILLFAIVLDACVVARADRVSFVPATAGSVGSSSTSVDGIVIHGYYFTAGWNNATLFGRNDSSNDKGIGVRSPGENCGTGSGLGDASNEISQELIPLTLPVGDTWSSVQLSSLDNNTSALPADFERVILFALPWIGHW